MNSSKVEIRSLGDKVGSECFKKMASQFYESLQKFPKYLTNRRTVHSKKKSTSFYLQGDASSRSMMQLAVTKSHL